MTLPERLRQFPGESAFLATVCNGKPLGGYTRTNHQVCQTIGNRPVWERYTYIPNTTQPIVYQGSVGKITAIQVERMGGALPCRIHITVALQFQNPHAIRNGEVVSRDGNYQVLDIHASEWVYRPEMVAMIVQGQPVDANPKLSFRWFDPTELNPILGDFYRP